MQTHSDTIFHNDLPNKKEKQLISLSKTKKLSLLERGSVIYVKDLKMVKEHLDKSEWQKIGYNHYTTH